MANQIYTLNADKVDRVIYQDGANKIDIRIRAGETIEVDLADPTQDAVFNEADYTQVGATFVHKLKPSA